MGIGETIIIGFLISLAGNLWQYNQVQDAQEEAEKWQMVAQKNYQALEKASEVANDNADLVIESNSAHRQCMADLEESRRFQAEFRRINADLEKSLEELAADISSTDWGSVRIPGSVDF